MLRNKRVAIEKERMSYVLERTSVLDDEILALRVPTLGVTVHLERTYPFSPPALLVDGAYAKKKFRQQYQRVQPLVRACGVVMPCVCCSPIRGAWCPTYGIRELLDEYVEMSTRLNQLEGYADIYAALPFDDAVHSRILNFL